MRRTHVPRDYDHAGQKWNVFRGHQAIERAVIRRSTWGSLAATLAGASVVGAQAPAAMPFGIGERLSYTVHGTGIGSGGKAVMAISGPVDACGTPTMLATFSVTAHLALLLNGSVVSRSWIDAQCFASLRFTKHEHRPLSSNDDSIEIYPTDRRWIGMRGDSGTMTTDAPLDELSFIYFLRTLPLVPDTRYTFDRFYDQRRSPTTGGAVQIEFDLLLKSN
jgi:hypothetical protein